MTKKKTETPSEKPRRGLWRVVFGSSYSGYQKASVPLWKALLAYKAGSDRKPVPHYIPGVSERIVYANGEGSRTQFPWYSGQAHLPQIDLDFDHEYVPSKTNKHGHLKLNIAISYPRWIFLLIALRIAKVIEPGFFWWSLRRGQSFLRK